MIISKTPYRLPISGGGTDLDFFYKKKNGLFSSVAIDQYVYVFLNERNIQKNFFVQTTSVEFKKDLKSINHKIIRETLKYYKISKPLHIGTYSTVPTGTGLGSSSAMVVGLINCINKYKKLNLSDIQIIKDAFKIERKICKLYGGWQDQIISQIGGFIKISISRKEKIKIEKLKIKKKIINAIQNRLIIVYTNQQRSAHKVSKSQKINASKAISLYEKIKDLNYKILSDINNNNFISLANSFDSHWQIKKKISDEITNNTINKLYDNLVNNFGCLGGKLIGAGGGGFLLMVVKNKKKTKKLLKRKGYLFLEFVIHKEGSKII
ncbi:hypothetical protein OAS95_02565 [Pelagibacteraceae bacterium]|jgi:D-glycero-alpha-D-manno-heptose-7-phosphate kinase|nr:hypothetical protein [Pelagibacteraceae bacterium]